MPLVVTVCVVELPVETDLSAQVLSIGRKSGDSHLDNDDDDDEKDEDDDTPPAPGH
jgi:hypothetical protein